MIPHESGKNTCEKSPTALDRIWRESPCRNAVGPHRSVNSLRKTHFVHVGRGFLPLLAVILLVAPPLAFANGPSVTVDPRSLDLREPDSESTDRNTGGYTVVFDVEPEDPVTVRVIVPMVNGNPVLSVDTTSIDFYPTDSSLPDDGFRWNDAQTVMVTALEDADAVDESVTITHMAVIDEDEVALRDATVTVHIEDPGQQQVLVVVPSCPDTPPGTLCVSEAEAAATYTVNLNSRPTGTVTVTVDKGRDAGEVSVSPPAWFSIRVIGTKVHPPRKRSKSTLVRIRCG